MIYEARFTEKLLHRSDGKTYYFDDASCVGSRDGQQVEYDKVVDMFPTGTERITYDDETEVGTYYIPGSEEVTETDASDRYSHVVKLMEDQVTILPVQLIVEMVEEDE